MIETSNPLILTTFQSLKRRDELTLYRKRKSESGKRQLSKFVSANLYPRIMTLLGDDEFLERVLDYYSSIQPSPPIIKGGNRTEHSPNKLYYAGHLKPLVDSHDRTDNSQIPLPKKEIIDEIVKPYDKKKLVLKTSGSLSHIKSELDTTELSPSIGSEGDNYKSLLGIVNSIVTKHADLEESISNINNSISNLSQFLTNNSLYSNRKKSDILRIDDIDSNEHARNDNSLVDTGKVMTSKLDTPEFGNKDLFGKISVIQNNAGDILISDNTTSVNLSEIENSVLKSYRIRNSLQTSTGALPKLLSDKRFSIFLKDKIAEYIKKNATRPSIRELGRVATENGFGLASSSNKAVGNVHGRRIKRILNNFNIVY